MEKTANYFVAGTDTGIGKTVLSLLMMQCFYENGCTPFYLKPFQTGCRDPYDEDSDAGFIYSHVKQLKGKDPADSVVYCYKNPKAPFFAARDQGRKITLHPIEAAIKQKCLSHSPLIIEGAGGVLVPVNGKQLLIDLIELINVKTVIAARAGLGTINHTLLTIEALKQRGISIVGVFLMASETNTVSEDMIKENIEAIETFSGIKVTGVIRHIKNFSVPDMESYGAVKRILSITL